ncbi:hypothetical protein LLE49_09045 [Alicyclobacillus tolerans]|uniref:MbeD/MobD family mobilization/exclusion protein n=1 Tax=Alicyclobacillus tolerans TaxID=90970 RepID=UPI001F252F96|nr:MbeD/MobD family mobilization/exclusion protein [Alicyclobacillus tolerans]MCF8564863.1 hypothetical protein [Alicyclobacillus tolerans]
MDAELKSFLENMQTNIQEKLSQFQSRFDNLETQISIMQDSQSKVKIDIKEIKQTIERLETKVDDTFEQVGKNAEGIVKIEHRVDDLNLTMRIMNRQNADTQLEVLKLKEKIEPEQ